MNAFSIDRLVERLGANVSTRSLAGAFASVIAALRSSDFAPAPVAGRNRDAEDDEVRRVDGSAAGNAPYKVLSLTWHSSRGVPFVNAQVINLPDAITLPNPFIAWGQGLSEAGTRFIQIAGIEDAVQDGLHQLAAGRWRGDWNELRADFLYERTFTTAKMLHEQLQAAVNQVAVTAALDSTTQQRGGIINPVGSPAGVSLGLELTGQSIERSRFHCKETT